MGIHQLQLMLLFHFRIVMLLAPLCTLDPARASEQLTARFRFLTGTTHAYIQLLLSNLPKTEGTSLSAHFLSKVILCFIVIQGVKL